MKRILILMIVVVAVVLLAATGWAAGTDAGTLIQNTATVTYDVGAATNLSATASTGFIVAEVLIVNVAPSVLLSTVAVIDPLPASDQRLYFSVQNTGNGSEAYALTVSNILVDFAPDNPRIVIDTVNIGSYDGTGVGGDTAYSGPYTIPEDGVIWVWVINDILDTPLADLDTGQSQLVATHTYAAAGTAPGTVVPGQGDDLGDGPGELVLGPGGGTFSDTATYIITKTSVQVSKSIASIADTVSVPGDQPLPGAVVSYLLTVQVLGSGDADNVVVRDPIPLNTTYDPASLFVNGSAEDDDFNPPGVDNSGYDGGNDWIEITLGTLNAAAGAQTVRFSVTID